jgi:hypothetical protein
MINHEQEYADLPKPWSPECYVTHELCCQPDDVESKYQEICKEFPYMDWGTHIANKVYDKEAKICHVIVRRFVSKRECLRHVTLPSTGWSPIRD